MGNPIIDSVVVDSGITQLTVSGSGFKPASTAPSVRFNGSTLTVGTNSNTQFVASLPSGLTSGSYLLEVENSDSFTCTTDFDVFIPTSSSLMSSFGYAISGEIWGHAQNISVTSSETLIPVFGDSTAPSNVYDSLLVSNGFAGRVSVALDSPVPSGSTLQAYLRNYTHSSVDSVTINSGLAGAKSSGTGLTISASGDQVYFVLKVSSGNSFTVSRVEWSTANN